MSPLNECQKKADKLERQLRSLRSQLESEKQLREILLRASAKEKLHTIMYSSMFKSVLESIEEDLVNARTASEARQWVTEIIDRFRPAFDLHNQDVDALNDPADALGIAFNKESLRVQYESILKEMREMYSI